MAKSVMAAEDKDWEAENDAHTLMQAKMICGDKKRHEKAMAAAERMAGEKDEEAKAMREAAMMDDMYPSMKKK